VPNSLPTSLILSPSNIWWRMQIIKLLTNIWTVGWSWRLLNFETALGLELLYCIWKYLSEINFSTLCLTRYRTRHSFLDDPLYARPINSPLVSSFFDKTQMLDLFRGCRSPNFSRNCCWHDIKEMPGSVGNGTHGIILTSTPGSTK
jgi:hypothetical protein